MIINCIAIEDEPLALKKICDFIQDVDFLHLSSKFHNAIDALPYVRKHPVDLIFLDIRMKKLSGLDFLKTLDHYPQVIITSAYEQYALDGYELDVADYLLKPFSLQRFMKAVNKVYNKLMQKSEANNKACIFVKIEYRMEKVFLEEIQYIEGMKDYLHIIMETKKLMTLQNFRNMLKILPDKEFIRVHKSFIIAINKIESIERNRIKIADKLIPISDSYRKGFFAMLKKQKYML